MTRQYMKREMVGLIILPLTLLAFFFRTIFLKQVYYLDDLKDFFYPLEFSYGLAQQSWQLPQWDTLFGFGHPLMHWAQLGFLVPVHIILRALNLHALDVLQLSMILHFGIGLAGMYYFLRLLKTPSLAATLGSIVFVYNGLNISHIQHINFFAVIMYLPWLFVILKKFSTKPTLRTTAMLSLVASAMTLGGHPQITLYCFIIAFLALPWLISKLTKRHFIYLLAASLLAFCLSSLMILPIIEFAPIGDRQAGLSTQQLYFFSYPPEHAITLVAPFFYGTYKNYHGAMSFHELGAYIGIIPLFLSIFALTNWQSNIKEKLFGLTLITIAITFALGRYSFLYRLLVEHHLFPSFTAPGRFVLFGLVAASLLSARGIHEIITSSNHKQVLQRTFFTTFLLLIAFSPFLLNENLSSLQKDTHHETSWAIIGLGSVITLIAIYKPILKKIVGTLTVIIATTTLLWLGWNLFPLIPREQAVALPHYIDYITEHNQQSQLPIRIYSDFELLQSQQEPTSRPTKRTDSLSPSFSIHQSINANQNHLSCIRIGLDIKQSSKETLQIHLTDQSTSKIIRDLSQPIDTLPDNGHHDFCFESIPNSQNQTYLLSITGQNIQQGNISFRYLPSETSQLHLVRVANPTPEQIISSIKPLQLDLKLLYQRPISPNNLISKRHLNVTVGSGGSQWIGSVNTLRQLEFVRKLLADDQEKRDGDGNHIINTSRNIFDMAGIDHFAQAVQDHRIDTMTDHNFTVVSEEKILDSTYRLYRNNQAFPKAFFVKNPVQVKDLYEAIDRLKSHQDDLSNTAYIESSQPLPLTQAANNNSTVDITSYQPTKVEISTTTNQPSWLILTDTYTPNWHASVNGEPTTIYPANGTFRAILVPAGNSKLSFTYSSPAIELSKNLTFLGLLITTTLLLIPRFKTVTHN